MYRDEMIKKLVKVLETAPKNASNYHIVDIMLSRAERLGMLPPPDFSTTYYDSECPEGYSPNRWQDDNYEMDLDEILEGV